MIATRFFQWSFLLFSVFAGIGLLLNGLSYSARHPVQFACDAAGSVSWLLAGAGVFLLGRSERLGATALWLLFFAVVAFFAPFYGIDVISSKCVKSGGQWLPKEQECLHPGAGA